jgi:hypothetical protein
MRNCHLSSTAPSVGLSSVINGTICWISDVRCDQIMPVEVKEGSSTTSLVLDVNPLQAAKLAQTESDQRAKISVIPVK